MHCWFLSVLVLICMLIVNQSGRINAIKDINNTYDGIHGEQYIPAHIINSTAVAFVSDVNNTYNNANIIFASRDELDNNTTDEQYGYDFPCDDDDIMAHFNAKIMPQCVDVTYYAALLMILRQQMINMWLCLMKYEYDLIQLLHSILKLLRLMMHLMIIPVYIYTFNYTITMIFYQIIYLTQIQHNTFYITNTFNHSCIALFKDDPDQFNDDIIQPTVQGLQCFISLINEPLNIIALDTSNDEFTLIYPTDNTTFVYADEYDMDSDENEMTSLNLKCQTHAINSLNDFDDPQCNNSMSAGATFTHEHTYMPIQSIINEPNTSPFNIWNLYIQCNLCNRRFNKY